MANVIITNRLFRQSVDAVIEADSDLIELRHTLYKGLSIQNVEIKTSRWEQP